MTIYKNKILCLICARGGSKGLKNKNIKSFCGKPLIYWTIKLAKSIKQIKDVYVSTDSKKIAQISERYGAKIPFIRPKKLATSNSKEWESWRHAIKFFEQKKVFYEALLILPVTSPLRSKDDVTKCIKKFYKERKKLDAVVAITDSSKNPYFNMVKKKKFTSLAINTKKQYFNRQETPKVYDLTTVAFLVKTSLIKTKNHLFKGKIRSIFVPKERSVDIDNLLDFKFAEFLKKKKNV